jgi:hypothetical protein
MKKIPDTVYNKFAKLSDEIKREFRRKGFVIPTTNDDGSIRVGLFNVVKNKNGFYQVEGINGRVVVDNINLPQTAAIVANDLALGRILDSMLIKKDQMYGYALFEEQLHKKSAEKYRSKNLDQSVLRTTKQLMSKQKKDYFKQEISKHFEKLRKFL